MADNSWQPEPLVRSRFALSGMQALAANLWRDATLMSRMKFLWGFKTFQVKGLRQSPLLCRAELCCFAVLLDPFLHTLIFLHLHIHCIIL